jgi:16S rRNA (uracil1498-N3)-methyltransferase
MPDREPSLRALPRLFLPGVSAEAPIELPKAEIDKFRKVLRLQAGDQIAILPNDGSIIRCRFQNVVAEPIEVLWPKTEPTLDLTLLQALPKGDRLETVVRMGTELGVRKFAIFPAVRSVAKWEPKKVGEKFRRLDAIIRESAEQSFRCRLPELEWHDSLAAAFKSYPYAVVLSEVEGIENSFTKALETRAQAAPLQVAIGPEGGWDPKEIALIGDRAVTLGPLVLRTDTAGVTAAALALLGNEI